jgi:prolipoprotein diacylglyceryltransferase
MIFFGVNPVISYIGSFPLTWYASFLTLAGIWLIIWGWLQTRKKQADFLQTDFTDGAGGTAVRHYLRAPAVPD